VAAALQQRAAGPGVMFSALLVFRARCGHCSGMRLCARNLHCAPVAPYLLQRSHSECTSALAPQQRRCALGHAARQLRQEGLETIPDQGESRGFWLRPAAGLAAAGSPLGWRGPKPLPARMGTITFGRPCLRSGMASAVPRSRGVPFLAAGLVAFLRQQAGPETWS